MNRPAGPADPDALAALEEERDFLLASLTDLDLEYEAGDLDEHDYRALKDDYTARAAETIRALEQGEARLRAAVQGRTWRRPAAIVGVVVLLAVGAGFLVAQTSGSRTTGEATGDIRLSTRDKLLQAQSLIFDDPVAALELFDEVLAVQPDNVEALTYRGWTLALAQQTGAALDWLGRAVDQDPDYPDARALRAVVLDRVGRPEEALADLRALDMEALPLDIRPIVEGLRERLEAAEGGP